MELVYGHSLTGKGDRLHSFSREQQLLDYVYEASRAEISGKNMVSITEKLFGETDLAGRAVLSTRMGLLFQADCIKLLRAIKDEVIDCVFADPPFNLGKVYGNGEVNDTRATQDYLKWSYAWIDECVRVVKPGGAIFIYILPQWGYRFACHLEDRGMRFRHWIALSMKGTFPRGRKLYPAHYALLYFTKGEPKTFNRVRLPIPACRHCGKDLKDYGGHRKYLNPLGLNLTDFWEDTAPARHRKFKARWHVNELKPMIPARCIEIATETRDIILDPFGGGGSTYQAAQALERFWLGCEITDCSPIIQRALTHFPQEIGCSPARKILSVFRRASA
jgi:site-specific DNA-methyltransferase (adenine-specific)